MGQKRVLLVAGEISSLDYLTEAIRKVYKIKSGNGEIRRINVNYAPLSVEDFKKFKNSGIGTYQIFQETYHYETYQQVHVSGPKKDYLYRLEAMDRAMDAGIDDVGIGALFGLYDYAFEVLALLMHCQHLEKVKGVGPHTISVPRIEPAEGAPFTLNPPHAVSDDEFRKIVAILRLAVPYTGIILSTRESAEMRNELLSLGVSQISAASKTNPGGYTDAKKPKKENELGQFSLSDDRSLREIIMAALELGYLPSFCTACYRTGRTGEHFMHEAKPGNIKNFCQVNGILTFKEYLLDYGDSLEKKLGEIVIKREIKKIASQNLKKQTIIRLKALEEGKRDLYF
jgi:2-iminoacetate synthase